MRTVERTDWPSPADFAAAPSEADIARWETADREARPARLARLRARLEEHGLDAYFGVRTEHMRYLTGLQFHAGEEKVAGHSARVIKPRTVQTRSAANAKVYFFMSVLQSRQIPSSLRVQVGHRLRHLRQPVIGDRN